MQNTVCDNAVRQFRNSFRNLENVGLMMWEKVQDICQKTVVNKTDYTEVTVCRYDR